MSAISTLTRRLTQLAIRPNTTINFNVNNPSTIIVRSLNIGSKCFAGMKKSKPASFLGVRWESNKGIDDDKNNAASSLASEKWKEFNTFHVDMESLDLSTNEPGSAKVKKTRGGKSLRKARQRELISKNGGITDANNPTRFTDVGPGQFPPMRFSDEETQRLLDEAYATMSPRAGKRGTRKAKRNRIKFWKVRKMKAMKKAEKVAHHFRTMEKRSHIAAEVGAMKEGAENVRIEEKEYQMEVLKQYAMLSGIEKDEVAIKGQHN